MRAKRTIQRTEAHYRRLLRLQPDNADTLAALASLQFTTGQRQQAEEYLAQAVAPLRTHWSASAVGGVTAPAAPIKPPPVALVDAGGFGLQAATAHTAKRQTMVSRQIEATPELPGLFEFWPAYPTPCFVGYGSEADVGPPPEGGRSRHWRGPRYGGTVSRGFQGCSRCLVCAS